MVTFHIFLFIIVGGLLGRGSGRVLLVAIGWQTRWCGITCEYHFLNHAACGCHLLDQLLPLGYHQVAEPASTNGIDDAGGK